jgi:acyl-CoA reductase-like NAD-dependent aldehyde dehydrogenase
MRNAAGELDHFEPALDVAARVGERLAVLGGEQGGELIELAHKEFDDLARLLSSEHGKTFAYAKGDVQRGLEVVEFACGIPHLLKGE